MAESNQTDWRELCAAAATEPDSERLADLVDQIIKALDERGELFTSPKQFDKIPSRESNIAKRLAGPRKQSGSFLALTTAHYVSSFVAG